MIPDPGLRFRVGDRAYDLTRTVLVVGILDAPAGGDALMAQADGLVAAGADLVEVAGKGEGERGDPGTAAAAVDALTRRLDVPVAVAAGDAAFLVAGAAAGAGLAVLGAGPALPGGLAVPDAPAALSAGLAVAAREGLSVVVTVPPGVAPGDTGDVLAAVAAGAAAGVAADRIVVDPALDRAPTPPAVAAVLRHTAVLARLGHRVAVTPGRVWFPAGPGRPEGRADSSAHASGRPERRAPTTAHPLCRAGGLAAVAYAVAHGARMVRTRDVAGTVRAVRMVEQLLAAAAP